MTSKTTNIIPTTIKFLIFHFVPPVSDVLAEFINWLLFALLFLIVCASVFCGCRRKSSSICLSTHQMF